MTTATIRSGQRYANAYHSGEHHVCREHAKTDHRALGQVLDARFVRPCEVCVEDACRIVLGELAHGRTLLEREIPDDARGALLDRELIHETFDRQYTATARAAGYTVLPSSFDL